MSRQDGNPDLTPWPEPDVTSRWGNDGCCPTNSFLHNNVSDALASTKKLCNVWKTTKLVSTAFRLGFPRGTLLSQKTTNHPRFNKWQHNLVKLNIYSDIIINKIPVAFPHNYRGVYRDWKIAEPQTPQKASECPGKPIKSWFNSRGWNCSSPFLCCRMQQITNHSTDFNKQASKTPLLRQERQIKRTTGDRRKKTTGHPK